MAAPSDPVLAVLKKAGIGPQYYAAAAYDCANLLITAIERALDQNGGRIPSRAQVLAKVRGITFMGATGTYTFGPDGLALKPAVSVYSAAGLQWSFWQNL